MLKICTSKFAYFIVAEKTNAGTTTHSLPLSIACFLNLCCIAEHQRGDNTCLFNSRLRGSALISREQLTCEECSRSKFEDLGSGGRWWIRNFLYLNLSEKSQGNKETIL
jgi:hypothetical protein